MAIFFEPDERWDDSAEAGIELAERLARQAWRISNLVLHSDLPWIDIELEINAMRILVEMEDPDHQELFEHLYVARFVRLREQWRQDLECA